MTKVTINMNVEIAVERIADLLICAFEGGSNYWYLIQSYKAPANYDRYNSGTKRLDYPLNEGGALEISSTEDDEIEGKTRWTLDYDACVEGLQMMAKKYPWHFAAILDESDDADTGDVYLQCCLFGEVVYG
jgi:hypothetical protein